MEMAKNSTIVESKIFIGDVRDKDRLHGVLTGVNYVAHAAATKLHLRQNIIL